MTTQPSLFDQQPPKPAPARDRNVTVIDLEKIRHDLHQLANPLNGEGQYINHNRTMVAVKKDKTITCRLSIREDDLGYTIKLNPKKIKTDDQLSDALTACRKVITEW